MKPKVLILIDTGIIGGPGKGLFQFIRHADPQHFEYMLCNFEYRAPRSTEFIDYAVLHSYNLYPLRQLFRFDPTPIFQTSRLLKSGGFNIIQTHGYKGHLIAYILSKLHEVPWVAMAHGWTNEDWKIRLYNRLESWLLKRADVAVAVSPSLCRTIAASRGFARPTQLILNAVDKDELVGIEGPRAVRERYGVGTNDILIGVFGRLSHEKGQDVLLHALLQVSRRFPNISLIVLGDGPERERLMSLADDLGLGAKVNFLGHRGGMRDYYEAIDLLVLPSRSEGLPNVVLEAMVLGKPVIATDVGAVKEIIENDRNGWIVPAGDAAALADKLIRILERPEVLRKMGERATDSLFPKFSPKVRAECIVDLYDKLMQLRLGSSALSRLS